MLTYSFIQTGSESKNYPAGTAFPMNHRIENNPYFKNCVIYPPNKVWPVSAEHKVLLTGMTGRLDNRPNALLNAVMYRVSDLFEGKEMYSDNSAFYKLIEPYRVRSCLLYTSPSPRD